MDTSLDYGGSRYRLLICAAADNDAYRVRNYMEYRPLVQVLGIEMAKLQGEPDAVARTFR